MERATINYFGGFMIRTSLAVLFAIIGFFIGCFLIDIYIDNHPEEFFSNENLYTSEPSIVTHVGFELPVFGDRVQMVGCDPQIKWPDCK